MLRREEECRKLERCLNRLVDRRSAADAEEAWKELAGMDACERRDLFAACVRHGGRARETALGFLLRFGI